MKKLTGLACVAIFILFLAAPLSAEEDLGQMAITDTEIAATEETGEGVLTGTVVDLNVSPGTITIKTSDSAEKTFSVVGGETILWKGIDDIELSAINKGEEAEIGYYTDESGKLIASWVDVMVEETAIPGNADIE